MLLLCSEDATTMYTHSTNPLIILILTSIINSSFVEVSDH